MGCSPDVLFSRMAGRFPLASALRIKFAIPLMRKFEHFAHSTVIRPAFVGDLQPAGSSLHLEAVAHCGCAALMCILVGLFISDPSADAARQGRHTSVNRDLDGIAIHKRTPK